MSDIILVSNLATPSSRVLQALDNAGLQTVDLLTLDVFEIHRRTQLSVIDVQSLVKDVIAALSLSDENDVVKSVGQRSKAFAFLTTGDEKINDMLGGGIPTGSLTEVTGERYISVFSFEVSGMGKSQLCLQLCVQVQLPRSLGGLDAGAIYIGTESALPTTRLAQIADSLASNLVTSPPSDIPTEDINSALEGLASHGDRIYYYNCIDLETQEHIVTYQLPVVLARYRVGLIILDSVTANYRAEFDRPPPSQRSQSQPAQMAQRSRDLRKLAGILKHLAVEWNVAVLAVNQVTDTFKRTSSQTISASQDEELLSLDYQAQWFDGLIDESGIEATKKPALGLVWANLITSRIMLVRDNPVQTRIKVVFSPFARPGSLEYAISSEAGIHAVHSKREVLKRVDDIESGFDLEGVELSDFDVEELLSG
jgi:DNA repair protein RAD57